MRAACIREALWKFRKVVSPSQFQTCHPHILFSFHTIFTACQSIAYRSNKMLEHSIPFIVGNLECDLSVYMLYVTVLHILFLGVLMHLNHVVRCHCNFVFRLICVVHISLVIGQSLSTSVLSDQYYLMLIRNLLGVDIRGGKMGILVRWVMVQNTQFVLYVPGGGAEVLFYLNILYFYKSTWFANFEYNSNLMYLNKSQKLKMDEITHLTQMQVNPFHKQMGDNCHL